MSFDKNTGDGQGLYTFVYDYRTRRVEVVKDAAPETKFVFSGGTSVQELNGGVLSAELVRGSDIGGGVGGLLYSLRSGTPSYTHYNARGDVVAKTDSAGALTYQAAYEAWGEIKAESGSTQDRQKSNSKDRDVPGYANEGFRYRDLETGAFLSKDPAGFVDGPNVYAYVRQNPWTSFDPEGLNALKKIKGSLEVVSNAIKKVNGRYPINMKFAGNPAVGLDDLSDAAKKRYGYLKNDPTFKGVPWKKSGHPDFTQYSQKINGRTTFSPKGVTGDVQADLKLLREHLKLTPEEMTD